MIASVNEKSIICDTWQGYATDALVVFGARCSDNLRLRNEPSVSMVSSVRVTLPGAQRANHLMRGVDFFMSSKLQRRIGNAIRLQFSGFTVQENIRPAWLTSDKGERLELDFYIKELDIAFEIQGEQHYSFTPLFHQSIEDFNAQVRRDVCKRRLCLKHGVELFEVTSVGEYEALSLRLSKILEAHKAQAIKDCILKKVAQEIINNYGVRKRLEEAITDLKMADADMKSKYGRRVVKHKLNLELSNERIRCLSVVAINEFEGRTKLKGKERYQEWKRKKYIGQRDGLKYKPLRNNRRLI
jgi:hypothetical protein